MRRITALLLAVIMALSLVVVAGAATEDNSGKVTLQVTMTKEKVEVGDAEITYVVSVVPDSGTWIGALKLTLTCPDGAKFTEENFNTAKVVYDSVRPGYDGIFAREIAGQTGELGGTISADGKTYELTLAGTDPTKKEDGTPTRMVTEELKLTELTVKLDSPAVAGKNYSLTGDLTAGWDDGNGGINHRHTIVSNIVVAIGGGVLLGDVNGDSKVNIIDVGMLYSYVLGVNKNLTAQQLTSADVNGDNVVNIIDVGRLYAYVLGTNKNPLG